MTLMYINVAKKIKKIRGATFSLTAKQKWLLRTFVVGKALILVCTTSAIPFDLQLLLTAIGMLLGIPSAIILKKSLKNNGGGQLHRACN